MSPPDELLYSTASSGSASTRLRKRIETLVDEMTLMISPLLPVGGGLPSGLTLEVSVVGSVVVVVGVASGMVVTASVVVVVVVSVVDVVLLVVVDVVLDVVVVVVDVVVVAGVQVHSFGWPGGTHMPGHARSPLGAVTSHCSPWSSLPLPQGNSSMAMSVRRLSATRWPMTTA